VTLLRRSFFNLLRSPGRTGMVVAILAVSLGLALTMYEVHGATANQLGTISSQIGTDITVRPAGSSGFQASSGTLAQTDVNNLNGLAHVVSVQSTTSTNYSGTVLTAAMPTSLPEGGNGRPAPTGGFSFRMPIQVQGLDPSNASPTLQGGGTLTMVSGAYFTADQTNANVMVIGQSLAEANDLLLGSKVDIEGTQVQVIGIFSSGQFFGDNTIIMPISTVQRLYNLDGDMYARIGSSITNAATSSQTGMIVSFIVAAAVILLAVLLVVRQRVREIGVLKAIGASNWRIGMQFGLETLILSVAAAVVGTGFTFVFAQRVADLFTSSGSSRTNPFGGGFGGGPGGGFGGGMGVISGNIGGIHVAISPEIFIIALGVALVLALIASVVPVWYIARVRPAEVLRNE
jgi:putative ABC transport system permease protein